MKNALVIIISFALVSSLFAQEFVQENPNKEDLTHSALTMEKVSGEKKFESGLNSTLKKSLSPEKDKSLVLGGVLSAIVPGAGEFYAKSYLKAAIFLALEAGMWVGYAVYQGKETTQTEYFRSLADREWDVRQYAQWIHDKVTGGASVNPQEPDLNTLRNQLNAVEATQFSHQLPQFGTQQYYELIGKYQSFVAGWKDADINVITGTVDYNNPNSWVNYKTRMQDEYGVIRQKANDYYDISTRFLSGVIINHVLSAADAVWSVHMFNSNLQVKTGMRVQERFGGVFMERYTLPTANISVQF